MFRTGIDSANATAVDTTGELNACSILEFELDRRRSVFISFPIFSDDTGSEYFTKIPIAENAAHNNSIFCKLRLDG